jgi:hypothetical protein
LSVTCSTSTVVFTSWTILDAFGIDVFFRICILCITCRNRQPSQLNTNTRPSSFIVSIAAIFFHTNQKMSPNKSVEKRPRTDDGSQDKPEAKKAKTDTEKNAEDIAEAEKRPEPRDTGEPKEPSKDNAPLNGQKSSSESSAKSTPDGKVLEPTKDDVLLGRGKPFQNHPGNQRMLEIVDERKEQYLAVKRDQKRAIVEEVLGVIQEGGASFLKRSADGHYWKEVEPAISFEKVSHALRSKVRRLEGSKDKEPSPAMGSMESMPNSIQIARNEDLRFAGNPGASAALYQPGIFSGGLYGPDAVALGLGAPSMMPPLYAHHGLVAGGAGHPGSGLNQLVRSQVVDTLLRQRRQLDDALNGVTGGMRLPPYM